MDIDHILDYYLHTGINFNIKRFFYWCYASCWTHITLFFHSIELIVLFGVLCYYYISSEFIISIYLGCSLHMMADVLVNTRKSNPYFYFLTYRILKGFSRKRMKLKEDEIAR